MKKYFKPTIEIETSYIEGALLAGLSTYDEVGSEDEFSNTSSYDDDMNEFKNKSLWSDEE